MVMKAIGMKDNMKIQSRETGTHLNVGMSSVFRRDAAFSFSYKFSDLIDEIQLEWPSSPMTPDCVRSYHSALLITSSQNTLPHCAMNGILNGSNTLKKFEKERQAVTYGLDVEYLNPTYNETNSKEHEINCGSDPNKIYGQQRQAPFERYADENFCTSSFRKWIEDYQLWHSDISSEIGKADMTYEKQRDRSVELNVRFAIYEPIDSGLADRTLHLVSTYLVALLTKRFLVFDDIWPEFQEIMISSLDFHSHVVTP